MSLSNILQEINKVKVYAEEDVSGGSSATNTSRLGRKRRAQEELTNLRERYIEELRFSAVFILVTGSNKDVFTDVATKEFGCFSADPEGFYKNLADSIPPVLYDNRVTSAALFEVIGRHLEDRASEMHLLSYPQLIYKQRYNRTVPNKDGLIQLLKESVNEQVGPEISGIYTLRALADQAIKAGHEGRITPIVMASNDEKLVIDLANSLGRLGSRAFMIATGKGSKVVKSTEGAFFMKEVDKEAVENILTNIKNMSKR